MSEHEPMQAVPNDGDWNAPATSTPEARPSLSTNLKNAALKVADAARTTVGALPGRRRSPRFRDHALYQSMQKYRLLAETLGLADPFFHEHDARLGATTQSGGRSMINFGGYDYCGLNQVAEVAAAAQAAITQYGTSVSASRVVAGERPLHREFERELADFYGTEDALAFVSGHATNVSTIATLVGEGDVIFHDELMHNSAIVGAKLSGAEVKCFPHNNLDVLHRLLMEHRGRYRNAIVIVEGMYSMDGDMPDLPRLVELKNRFGAWLMVDEAHSLGVLGATGRGIAEHAGVPSDEVDIWMGTLSKTLASCGGYICGSKELIMILKFKAPGFVYSVGMPAPAAAAALAALRVLKAQPERVARVRENGKLFLEEARSAGLDTGLSEGYCVVPVIIGDGIKAVKMTERLAARGINALPIIYPAVPMKAARLRFFITSEHTAEHIVEAVRVTKEELKVVTSLGGILRRTPTAVAAS